MELLGDRGYRVDPGRVEETGAGYAFVHFTHERHLAAILALGSGVVAQRRTTVCPDPERPYIVEMLLEPAPVWVTASPYFGDLGAAMFADYVGAVPLRVTVPRDRAGVWVADAAHALECKHATRRGSAPLGLGYDCATGHAAMAGWLRSHVPVGEYRGGHVAPVVAMYAAEAGIVVPATRVSRIEV